MIRAFGELDALNTPELVDRAERALLGTRSLIVDLIELRFFAARGIGALLEIGRACDRAGVGWALVTGGVVDLVLRVCATGATLPVFPSLQLALHESQLRGDPEERRMTKISRKTGLT